MAQRITESVSVESAPMHMVMGSQALCATIRRLEAHLTEYKAQTELAASTDIKE